MGTSLSGWQLVQEKGGSGVGVTKVGKRTKVMTVTVWKWVADWLCAMTIIYTSIARFVCSLLFCGVLAEL
jgi:hypothetical protein